MNFDVLTKSKGWNESYQKTKLKPQNESILTTKLLKKEWGIKGSNKTLYFFDRKNNFWFHTKHTRKQNLIKKASKIETSKKFIVNFIVRTEVRLNKV